MKGSCNTIAKTAIGFLAGVLVAVPAALWISHCFTAVPLAPARPDPGQEGDTIVNATTASVAAMAWNYDRTGRPIFLDPGQTNFGSRRSGWRIIRLDVATGAGDFSNQFCRSDVPDEYSSRALTLVIETDRVRVLKQDVSYSELGGMPTRPSTATE